MSEFLEAVSSEGRRVFEADLGDDSPDAWIARARERDAELLWLHTDRDLSGTGFERFPGYVRLRAQSVEAGEPLPPLQPEDYVPTLELAYRGLWGHKRIEPDAEPPAGAVVLGLYERGEPIGLCSVFPPTGSSTGPGCGRGRGSRPRTSASFSARAQSSAPAVSTSTRGATLRR